MKFHVSAKVLSSLVKKSKKLFYYIWRFSRYGWGETKQIKEEREFSRFSLEIWECDWKTIILTSLSSSSKVNSFFLTCFSWLRKLNSAAFFWSLANLFSYLDTFFRVGFMLKEKRGEKHIIQNNNVTLQSARRTICHETACEVWEIPIVTDTYNLPRRSLTWLFKSAICTYRIIHINIIYIAVWHSDIIYSCAHLFYI